MPNAQPDLVRTQAGTAVVVPVLLNDNHSANAPLILVSTTPPAHGSVTINPDQTITYQPVNGYIGPDSFTYTIRDLDGAIDSARVNIVVDAEDEAPVAQDDAATTSADTAVIVPVLANDSDPKGGPLRVVELTQPAYGTATVRSDQTIRYTPAPGYVGVDGFTYTIADLAGQRATAGVTVTVASTNRIPAARNNLVTTSVDEPVTVPALANDDDADGDPLFLVAVTQPDSGVATRNPDQTITYQPNPGFLGSDRFSYTLSDGRGGVAAAIVRVTVEPPNVGPTAVEDAVSTAAATPVVIQLLGNDNDPEDGLLTLVAIGRPDNGSVAVNPDQSVTYRPNDDFSGTDGFTYTVSDDKGATATGTVTVTVANTAPIANDDVLNVYVNVPRTIDVLANDADPQGDPLTVIAVSNPANGAAVIETDGRITYTPNVDYTGSDSFDYTVSDGAGGTDTATVNVLIDVDSGEPWADGTFWIDDTGWRE